MSYYHGHNYSGRQHAANHCRQTSEIMYGTSDIQVYSDKSAKDIQHIIGCLKI